jgi:hypothetical protein
MTANPFYHPAPPAGSPIDPRTGYPAAPEPPAHLRDELLTYRRTWAAEHPDASSEDVQAAVQAQLVQLVRRDPAVVALRERVEEARAARRREDQERQAATERAAQQAGATALELERVAARAAWLANGGTGAEFAERWPALRADLLHRRTIAEVERRRADELATARAGMQGGL